MKTVGYRTSLPIAASEALIDFTAPSLSRDTSPCSSPWRRFP